MEKIIEKVLDILSFFIKRKRAGDAFADNAQIIYAIRSIIHDEKFQHLNVQRAVIAKAHNDSGEMNPLSYKYVTVSYDDYREPFGSIKSVFQKVPVDAEYTIMLGQLYQKKSLQLTTTTMPDGLVKQSFTDNGVVYSQMYFLKHTKKEFWYINLGTSAEGENFSSNEHKLELYLLIGLIRRLLKQY